ncbi:glucose 1-dehydrogenase [Pseudomonas sp. CDFA 553]|uniref:SDR family NAD(P)-dependent oxidoreductase n=1 Tax=Pseudomonas quasicaspiana TaxID=2829821 RepID=UPI001E5D22B9|nr:glucose 1-dehydrogenase [Pseudomonas quasicaspiana]MCD5987205.1 glucose 1-dehydrogenase [Pseudomonas quasicaspiana]
MIMGRLSGKTAIVTGARRGIGQAIAQRFISEGANVAIITRSTGSVEGLRSNSVMVLAADVTQEGAVEDLFTQVRGRFGRIDIVVNNAGVQLEKPIGDTSPEEWDYVMAANVRSVFLCSKAAIQSMKETGGVILNIGSYDGLVADPDLGAYCASKGAVHALTRSIAVDYGKFGIRCNAICPGWIRTEMMAAYLKSQQSGAEAERKIVAQHPAGRLGEPADIANLATWLVSDEATFATGQLYVMDGGLTAHAPYVSSI